MKQFLYRLWERKLLGFMLHMQGTNVLYLLAEIVPDNF